MIPGYVYHILLFELISFKRIHPSKSGLGQTIIDVKNTWKFGNNLSDTHDPRSRIKKKIVAAFRGIHVSPAKQLCVTTKKV